MALKSRLTRAGGAFSVVKICAGGRAKREGENGYLFFRKFFVRAAWEAAGGDAKHSANMRRSAVSFTLSGADYFL